jgi:hypothetical protein
MSDIQHTPGPWEIKTTLKGKLVREERNAHGEASSYRAYIRKGEPGTAGFQIVCDVDFGYGRKTDEANARLIATAPELLEALEMTRGQWIHSVNAKKCLAVIAKARGDV